MDRTHLLLLLFAAVTMATIGRRSWRQQIAASWADLTAAVRELKADTAQLREVKQTLAATDALGDIVRAMLAKAATLDTAATEALADGRLEDAHALVNEADEVMAMAQVTCAERGFQVDRAQAQLTELERTRAARG